MKKLSEIIAVWNLKISYHSKSNLKKKQSNSFLFIKTILREIGMMESILLNNGNGGVSGSSNGVSNGNNNEMKINHPMIQYFKKQGELHSFQLYLSQLFIKKFQIMESKNKEENSNEDSEEMKLKFKNHISLDKILKKLIEIDSNFISNFYFEYIMIRNFDFIMWVDYRITKCALFKPNINLDQSNILNYLEYQCPFYMSHGHGHHHGHDQSNY
jgi:hypothetical protein